MTLEIFDYRIFGGYAAGMDDTLARRERLKLRRLLRAIRCESGLTQAELAERMGRSQSAVSNLERRKRRVLFLEVDDFCKAVGMSLEDFCERLDATPDEAPPAQDP